jgi:hypothetical protein
MLQAAARAVARRGLSGTLTLQGGAGGAGKGGAAALARHKGQAALPEVEFLLMARPAGRADEVRVSRTVSKFSKLIVIKYVV